MGQTVNLLAYAFGGSNPSLPTPIKECVTVEDDTFFFCSPPPLFRAEHKIAGDGLSSVLAEFLMQIPSSKTSNYHIKPTAMNEKIVNKLEQFPSATPSRWREKAEERRESEAWRRESRRIALMMLDRLEALGMSQTDLAARLGCTQQYVSRILKGHENLSLKTICKIDDVLKLGIWAPAEREMCLV